MKKRLEKETENFNGEFEKRKKEFKDEFDKGFDSDFF
jgi:hypothetical protein